MSDTTRKKSAKPSLNPQRLPDVGDRASWYYESRRYLTLYAEGVDGGGGKFLTTTRIPWSRIMESASRCGWKVSRA